MKIFEGKTPKERRNLMIIMVAAPLAFLGIIYNLGFFSSKKKPTTTARATRSTTATNNNLAATTGTTAAVIQPQDIRDLESLQPIRYSPALYRSDLTLGRNIFSYYVPPRPTGTPVETIVAATPEPQMPTPVPPSLILASMSPSNVYARTKDFQLLIGGDKFTADTRIYINGQELPTQFVSPQQLKTNIPAALITSAGARAVVVRTPDNSLFSNQASLNVMPPPVPQYTYVGLVGARNARTPDTAILKPQTPAESRNNDLVSVQRGDTVGGRFILNNISANTLELTDKELGIKHTLPFVESRTSSGGGFNQQTFNNRLQPQQPPAVTDDEGEYVIDEDEEEEEPQPTRKP
ncbi:MAG: IPT/TIG domain-containing protein [Pyrinomonadaceae bacterium MAG19_C2-C3]|nr:IPT/TIG domain-containing protein [Pyrinomonadaceae bacterium MAG19_C2-C3]